MGHVLVVASGFGKRVIPMAAPFRFSTDVAGSLVVAVGDHPPAIVGPTQDLTAAQTAARGVADVAPGPEWPTWWLQTHPFRVPLPAGWTAHASGSVSPSVFDLIGPRDSMLFVQMPRNVPPVDEMVAPGQRVVGKGVLAVGEWITVEYGHDGISHLQRHIRIRVGERSGIVTLQCPADAFALVDAAQLHLADAIRPGEAPSN